MGGPAACRCKPSGGGVIKERIRPGEVIAEVDDLHRLGDTTDPAGTLQLLDALLGVRRIRRSNGARYR
jgi:hypothetical protein